MLHNVKHAHGRLRDTTEGIEVPNKVFLQSFDTQYVCMLLLCGINCSRCTLYSEEGIEGDVISNPTCTTAEDDPETKVRLLSNISRVHDCMT